MYIDFADWAYTTTSGLNCYYSFSYQTTISFTSVIDGTSRSIPSSGDPLIQFYQIAGESNPNKYRFSIQSDDLSLYHESYYIFVKGTLSNGLFK